RAGALGRPSCQTLGLSMQHSSGQILDATSLFVELGRATYVFQAMEARIKLLLPFLSVPGKDEPPPDEGWDNWRKYLDSKEMLGNLVRLFQERVASEDPAFVEKEWRSIVQCRNDVIHHFALQPFARCSTQEELHQSIAYIRERRLRATPMLKLLEILLHGLVAAMQAPANHEGELHVELPEWLINSA
ncbi:TPA: hypothetical protein ACQTZN_006800, partial [Pseudomonas aeruginosa]